MTAVEYNDLVQITQETVDWFKGTRWECFFRPEHVGECVRYAGEGDYSEQGTRHMLGFQVDRGIWHMPNCSLDIITNMRQAYLVSQGETQHA